MIKIKLDSMESNNEPLSFSDLWQLIWNDKLVILIVTIVFGIISVFYALSVPNTYKSQALLTPNEINSGSGDISGLVGQFGGLASLAGIGASNSDRTDLAIEILKSRAFLYDFISDNQLDVLLLAVESWEQDSNTMKYNSKVYNNKTKEWKREVSFPFKNKPHVSEVYEIFLDKHLEVDRAQDTGFVNVSIIHYSPYVAKNLLEKLIDALNEKIKLQDMKEAGSKLKYLEQELKHTDVADMKSMFYELIENEQKTLMLTKVREDYVFKVLDAPYLPMLKFGPKRSLICAFITMLGFILSVTSVVIIRISSSN